MEFEDNSYNLNLEAIASDISFHSSVRLLALFLKENPYYRIGEFLKSLSQTDLTSLQEICEKQTDNDEEVFGPFENIMLLGLMLANAEGVAIEDENVHSITNVMIAMITMESLRRKGFVEVNYDKVSFGEEYKHEVVVRKTEKFDNYLDGLEDE